MVVNCVAYGCNNLQDSKKAISFHTFPFKRPEILSLWIKAIRRDDWYPSKTSRICGEHFLLSDYQLRPDCNTKLLKIDVVPSIFSFPKHLLKKVNPRRKLVKIDWTSNQDMVKPSTSSEPMETEVNSEALESIQNTQDLPQHSSKEPRVFEDKGTQTVEIYKTSDKLLQLKRKVKSLKQKVKRRDSNISSMKDVIKEITKSGHSNESLTSVLNNYFEGLPLELVLQKKVERQIEHPSQRRYSPLMKQFAHTLYFYSPKAYNFLKQYFILPNGRTIRKWLKSLNCEPGLLQEVLEYLKKEVQINSNLKDCALIVDAMSIRKQVLWDDSLGRFTGNVNYGEIIDVSNEMPASEGLLHK